VLGEVGIPNITEMHGNHVSFGILDEYRFLLRIRSNTLDLSR
jgi:hypothetical protein